MRILITGGAGFIGSHLVEHFQGKATEIRVLDNLRTGNPQNLAGFDHTFIKGSITDPVAVDEAVAGIDYIFHLAALVSVPQSVTHPHETVQINVQGLLHVLEAAARHGAKKLVFASSAAIYGDNPTVPKTEEMLPEPQSPYAVTKLDGEFYLNLFRSPGGLDTCALRFFNVFGPRQDPKGAYAAAIPIFIEKALRNETITIYGDGDQTRDFIYVKDIVSALEFVAFHPVSGCFNAGYGGQVTINTILDQILSATDSKSPVNYVSERAGDVRHSRASVEKLNVAGWHPQHSLGRGLEETLAFFCQSISQPSANSTSHL